VAEALKERNMPEKKIILPWSTLKRDNEVKEYLRNNEYLPLPLAMGMLGPVDQRILNALQYRDSIRMQCRCLENGLQLADVTMNPPPSKYYEDG
jgi:hypothetical protein